MTQQSIGKLFQIATACEKREKWKSLCKWFVQGLYTRGAFGKSMNPWMILYKWHIF